MSRAAVIAVVAALLAPVFAEARPLPGVTRPIAEREVRSLMQKIGTWRYRTGGYMDCSRGKINRARWACRVGWYKGRFCRFGRVQVYGFLREDRPWYGTRLRAVRCVFRG